MTIRNMLGVAFLGLSVAVAAPAFAKKGASSDSAANPFDGVPTITTSGVAEFDDVFGKAATIQTNVKGIYDGVATARSNVNTTLGVATDAPLATALESLKTNAAGKVSVAMDGTMPKLKASDGMPDNAKAALDAVNSLVSAGGKAVTDTAALVDQVKSLVDASKAFPMKVPGLLKSLDAEKAKALPGIVTDNVKGIKALPSQLDAIKNMVTGVFTDITNAFKG